MKEHSLFLLVNKLLSLPEIGCIKIRELEIHRNNKNEMIKPAVNECYQIATAILIYVL